MFYLLFSVSCSLTISVLMKLKGRFVKNEMVMFAANYLICSLLSFYYSGSLSFNGSSLFSIQLGLISGFLFLFSFVISARDIEFNGVVMSSAFSKLGVIVPLLLGLVLFNQKLSVVASIGILIALTAIFFLYFDKEGLKMVTLRWLLAVHLLVSGITDATIGIYDFYGNALYKDQFLFFNFFFALIFALMVAFKRKEKFGFKDFIFGLLIGLPNYYSSRFLMLALGSVPAVLAYPIVSAGSIVSIAFMGVVAFGEDFSLRKGLSFALIVVALVLMNL